MQSTLKKITLLSALISLSVPFYAPQQAMGLEINAPTFIDDVKVNLLFRPRYEYVDDHQPNTKPANALTVRTSLGVQINKIFQVNGLKAYIEATDVGALVDDYSPQKTGYAQVNDPDIARITEAYISYTYNKTTFMAGRMRVNIDDERFIGSVDWRQMPQTFGVIGIKDNTISNLDLLIAGIYERKGVSDNLNKHWRLDKMPIILHGSYKFIPQFKITAYGYLLTDLSNTYGINITGDIPLSKDVKFGYLGEYAIQKDPYAKDNVTKKPKVDADFYRVEAKLSGYGFFGIAGYERFQGADKGEDKGFTTPLATLHKWEGWADNFLGYIANTDTFGLKDAYITLGYGHKDYGTALITYHKFDADKNTGYVGNTLKTISSKNFGSEIDLSYTVNLTKRLNFLAKAAFYDGKKIAGSPSVNDLTKYWLQLTYKY
ncbi:MAG: alginate export family protein [Hydrogenothermaceae bacterium]|nr:alginate export family protein [Hydrogenothermaceae bacterium]